MERFCVTPSSSLWTLAWPPHAYKGPCLFGRPARRHSRMRVQLMASARHAIGSRDVSLLPMPYGHVRAYNHMTWRLSRLYYLWFHVELLYCWCCCGLFYDYVERTRVSKERRFLHRWSGSAPFHRARTGH